MYSYPMDCERLQPQLELRLKREVLCQRGQMSGCISECIAVYVRGCVREAERRACLSGAMSTGTHHARARAEACTTHACTPRRVQNTHVHASTRAQHTRGTS